MYAALSRVQVQDILLNVKQRTSIASISTKATCANSMLTEAMMHPKVSVIIAVGFDSLQDMVSHVIVPKLHLQKDHLRTWTISKLHVRNSVQALTRLICQKAHRCIELEWHIHQSYYHV